MPDMTSTDNISNPPSGRLGSSSKTPTVVDPTVKQPGAQFLRCSCGTPVAAIQNGVLIIRSRHHGEQHQTVFSLVDLIREAREAAYDPNFYGQVERWPDGNSGAGPTMPEVREPDTVSVPTQPVAATADKTSSKLPKPP